MALVIDPSGNELRALAQVVALVSASLVTVAGTPKRRSALTHAFPVALPPLSPGESHHRLPRPGEVL